MTSKIVVNNIEADAGVSTVFFNSDIGATDGTLNVDGNLSVDGVITYEDVTNVDSVGIVTARSGIHVTSGLVGIGTDIPNAILHVEKDGTSQVLARFESNMGTNNNRSIALSSPTSDSGSEPFIFNTGNAYQFQTDDQVALHINYNRNIGIGTDNPATKLNVVGDTRVEGFSNAKIQIKRTGNTVANGSIEFLGSDNSFGWGLIANYDAGGSNFNIKEGSDSRLYIKSGNIGIGTDNPSARLDVVSNDASAYIAEFRQAHASNTAQIIIDSPVDGASRPSYMDYATGGTVKWRTGLAYLDANRSFHIGTGSIPANSKLIIKPDGNVGVGNSDPTQAKFVAQTASGMSIAAVKDNTGASISLGGVTQPRILMEAGASASQLKLYTASGSSYSSAGWRQRLHVTDTNASVSSAGSGANGIGCFGIDDNGPDSRALALSIGGGSGLYGIEDPRPLVYLQRSYGVGGGSSTDETTLEISAPGSYNSAGIVYGIKCRVQHNLNGSHYAGHFEGHGSQYSANGTSALYAKTTKLDTNGGGDVIAFRADASITTGIANNGAAIAGYFASGNNINGKPIVCQNGLTSNNWANQIIFRKHNGSGIVDVGSIKSSNTATQYNTSSDYRLKENIVSLTGAIDRLKQLQPKRFNFIGVDETIDGFIAHEVTSVAPYAVSGEKDAVKKELVLDEDGKEQFDENGEIIDREVIDPQSVDYSKLTTLTIAALQEALAKIETLEAAVAALQGS